MNAESTHSYSYDELQDKWHENSPNFNEIKPNKIQCALTLLDQIIDKEKQNDDDYKKQMAASPNIKDWEKSIGESWTLFHLKRLKELLK